jgi:hypothetical protein
MLMREPPTEPPELNVKLRRLPVNLRPLLGIRRGLNPVTLGLAVEAYAYLAIADPENAKLYRSRALFCIKGLKRLRSPGYSGSCWGYDFPWESRWGKLQAYSPTIVATGMITNGLFSAYTLLGIEEAFDLCSSASDFVLRDLERTPGPDGSFCWGYAPGDRQQVINATMKGARLCAQVHAVAPNEELRESARLTAQFAAQHQRADGAWPYAVADRRSWVDNFHTGYVLVCFREYALRTELAQRVGGVADVGDDGQLAGCETFDLRLGGHVPLTVPLARGLARARE